MIDEITAPDIRFEYSLHTPLLGRDAVREFAHTFRGAFPDLGFEATAGLIAEGDYVVGRWIGGGTHTGAPMTDLPLGGLPNANTGKRMRFTGTTVPHGPRRRPSQRGGHRHRSGCQDVMAEERYLTIGGAASAMCRAGPKQPPPECTARPSARAPANPRQRPPADPPVDASQGGKSVERSLSLRLGRHLLRGAG